jgi:hypothetical protein
MTEFPTEHPEGTGLVAEAARGLFGRDPLSEKTAEGLILALAGMGRLKKEPLF